MAKYQSITGDELAEALIRAAVDPEYENRILERHEFEAIFATETE